MNFIFIFLDMHFSYIYESKKVFPYMHTYTPSLGSITTHRINYLLINLDDSNTEMTEKIKK